MTELANTLVGEKYRLRQRIGKGGFGDVWAAFDETTSAEVAIKLLDVTDRSRSAALKKIERFRREAMTLASIQHENVVAIYDVGTVDEKQVLFLVMEYLHGRTVLEELHLAGPMGAPRVLRRTIEGLRGLHAAHQIGVVHKDIKPANLFLDDAGTPAERLKVIDFGIARMGSLSKLTSTGRMAGSPRYLAPEYILGDTVTPAVDVYQMALILVEMLTGEACVPQGLDFLKTCQRHILGELDLSPMLLDTPLGPVVRKALERFPAERYGSAGEFADALETIDPALIPQFDIAPTIQMAAGMMLGPEITAAEISTLRDLSRSGMPSAEPEGAGPGGPLGTPAAPAVAQRPSRWIAWLVIVSVLAAFGALVAAMRLVDSPSAEVTTAPSCAESCLEYYSTDPEIARCKKECGKELGSVGVPAGVSDAADGAHP